MQSFIKHSLLLTLFAALGMTASTSSNPTLEKICIKKEKSSCVWRLFSTGIDLGLLGTCITSGTLAVVLHTAAENDRTTYNVVFPSQSMLQLAHIFNPLADLVELCGGSESTKASIISIFVNDQHRSSYANGVALGCAVISAASLGLLLLKRSYSKENSKKQRWLVSQHQ